MRTLPGVLVAALVGLAACGGADDERSTQEESTSTLSQDTPAQESTTTKATATTSTTAKASTTTTRPPTPPDRAYSLHCSSCHGAHGEGMTGPKLGGGQVVVNYPDVAALFDVVSDGLDPGMPGFKNIMSAHEIEGLIDYVIEDLSGEP